MNQRIALALSAGGLLMVSRNAFAYIDPSAGNAILQGILRAMATLSVALGLYWHR